MALHTFTFLTVSPRPQLQARGAVVMTDIDGAQGDLALTNINSDPTGTNYRGLCMYGGCYTTAGEPCSFPFKYKGRTYDTCVKLEGATDPWCSLVSPSQCFGFVVETTLFC